MMVESTPGGKSFFSSCIAATDFMIDSERVGAGLRHR